ncbi:DUF2585 family protein [Novipirellula artificiosorum]|uniref:Uncharacterized protein n=1 Tax=Novipirellula artificiosorum TaxID=2528016 RepID=A0A5C6E0M7_9BACT|nr:DUF2585 family protein [Novipirellula artificiosorum]TWU42054.1 hypothetical protein Poly41_03500 [Novipirellula artificiosorum]
MNERERERTDRGWSYWLIAIALLMMFVLSLLGRVWWCQTGDLSPWSWDIWSSHNSQHLFDPYSLSHLEHGLALWLILHLSLGKKLRGSTLLIVIAFVEAVWEIVENTPMMIERYREVTISLDYFGDSILNSLSDYVMCVLGAVAASRMRWQWSLAAVVALEAVSVLWIRDSLLLNIIMLIYPIDVIRVWQSS